MKGKYLITCDNWFVAPDGHSYLAVWGDCETVTTESALGLVPNRNSANWFVKVSNNGEEMIVAGCQIHYAASCPERPNTDKVDQSVGHEGRELRDTRIYIPGEGKGLEKALATDKSDIIRMTKSGKNIVYNNVGGSNFDFMNEIAKRHPQIDNNILHDDEKSEFENLIKAILNRSDKREILGFSIFDCDKIVIEFADVSDFECSLIPF